MSSTPPDGPAPQDLAPIPAGYQAGEYVPFKDRDPSNPSSIAGQWADPGRQAQLGGDRPMTAEERYRAIYGYDAAMRVEYAPWIRRVLGTLVDAVLSLIVATPLFLAFNGLGEELHFVTDPGGRTTVSDGSDVSVSTIAMLGGGCCSSSPSASTTR